MPTRDQRQAHFDVIRSLAAGPRAPASADSGVSREESWIAVASLLALAGTLVIVALGASEDDAAATVAACVGGAVLLASIVREITERDLRGLWRWVPLALLPFFYDRPLSLAGLAGVRQLVMAARTVGRHRRGREAIEWLWTHPVEFLALGFAATIAVGTFFLMLPASSRLPEGVSLVDALFTATSATCVTGLTVVDTASAYTPFGQAVVAVLIQIGGIGVMTLSTVAAVFAGRQLGLKQIGAVSASMETVTPTDAIRIVKVVVKATFVTEALGAAILTIAFLPEMAFHRALANGVFHSVSAFCNAGFALWTNNLEPYAGDPVVMGTIAALIVLGGLGFLVIAEVAEYARSRKRPRRSLTLHARMVLIATGILIVVGSAMFLLLEWHGALADLDGPGKAMNAVFMSITTRTAGFNTLAMGSLEGATVLLFLVLMFVGASPGSTGGGIKTTTAGVLLLSVRAYIRGRSEVEVGGRTIPGEVVIRAVALVALSLSVVLVGLFLLLATQDVPFQPLLFEAVSAFGTVGLSIGATAEVDSAGKLIITALMYVGRVGPLTLVLLLGSGAGRSSSLRYPSEPVALT